MNTSIYIYSSAAKVLSKIKALNSDDTHVSHLGAVEIRNSGSNDWFPLTVQDFEQYINPKSHVIDCMSDTTYTFDEDNITLHV
jgi:hypothetical protein